MRLAEIFLFTRLPRKFDSEIDSRKPVADLERLHPSTALGFLKRKHAKGIRNLRMGRIVAPVDHLILRGPIYVLYEMKTGLVTGANKGESRHAVEWLPLQIV